MPRPRNDCTRAAILIVTMFLVYAYPVESQTRGLILSANSHDTLQWFRNSWAVVIGVDRYKSSLIPPLRYANGDAKAIAEVLVQNQGFMPQRVLELYDEDASRQNILKALDELGTKSTGDDRIVFFFAGHGMTLPRVDGNDRGFVLPHDAEPSKPESMLSVEDLLKFSEHVAARHVYFVMDACYGGMIFTRSLTPETGEYLSVISRRKARMAITAGGRDQQVMDGGSGQHSVFTFHLLTGIVRGAADLNQDGLITGTELASYVSPLVTSSSRGHQTPEYGSLPGSLGGEFVFMRDSTIRSVKDDIKESDQGRFDLISDLVGNKTFRVSGGVGYAYFKNNYFADARFLYFQVDKRFDEFLVGLNVSMESGTNNGQFQMTGPLGPELLTVQTQNIYVEARGGFFGVGARDLSLAVYGGVGLAFFSQDRSYESTYPVKPETLRKTFLSVLIGTSFDYFPLGTFGLRLNAFYRLANNVPAMRGSGLSQEEYDWQLLDQTGGRVSVGIVYRF